MIEVTLYSLILLLSVFSTLNHLMSVNRKKRMWEDKLKKFKDDNKDKIKNIAKDVPKDPKSKKDD